MLSSLLNTNIMLKGLSALVVIGLIFFLLQVLLCMLFCRRLRHQEQWLNQLTGDYETGGSGRLNVRDDAKEKTWYQWVLTHFPQDEKRLPGNFSREDALHELDTRIACNGSYLLLQRMGVMAPLLGVVLTVAGFYWLNVRDDVQSLQGILQAVTPLVAGVGTGAVLALVNQVLLHVAGRRVESFRLAGRSWFDTIIWRNRGSKKQLDSATSAQVVEEFIRDTLEDVERLATSLARAAEINAAISDIPDRIRCILDQNVTLNQPESPGTDEPFVTRLPRTAR
jgi:hypothetical protein